MKIALFGGTFDPIHRGHLELAKCAQKQFGLDKIIFMPAFIAPNKAGQQPAASAADRCMMIRSAIDGLNGFELSTLEIERGGISYTLDTLQQITRQYPGDKLFLIIGEDSYEAFSLWHQPAEILKMAELIVAPRNIRNSSIRGKSGNVHWLEMREVPAASSDIRRAIRENTISDSLLPETVLKFIQQRKLYQSV